MPEIRNVLFIMCDQLRADYLSCYGHPVIETPNIDRLANRGVRFTRAFVQGGVCGSSRMSFYTGRYAASHRATWNFVPLPIDELTLGDYLTAAGRRAHLIGKTHFAPDTMAMHRCGIEDDSEASALLREGGFTLVARHEGDLPTGKADYTAFLRSKGYQGQDPWLDYAVAVRTPDGGTADGWHMRNAHLPARVAEEHSETAYVTDTAIDFIRRQGETPWVLHLSYIKPHWPYVAPAPYHALYRDADTGPVLRDAREAENEHPVVSAYRRSRASQTFADPAVARHVRPTYMGLVRQIDTHIGRILDLLESLGRLKDTLIVFTSDHGDYLGDHGLGEKELFHDIIHRVPFLLVDPTLAADGTRGSVDDRFVEAIDVLPTILDALALPAATHRLEGRSLLPLTRGEATAWRSSVVSELDYGLKEARRLVGLPAASTCRAIMLRSAEWKYVYWHGFRPQLFNLADDPDEFADLGANPRFRQVGDRFRDEVLDWLATRRARATLDFATIERRTGRAPDGIHIGLW